MKKKLLSLLVIVAMIISLFCIKSYAVSIPILEITSNDYSAGDEVTLSDEHNVDINNTLQLHAITTYYNDFATPEQPEGQYVLNSNFSGVTWTSSNTSIATVDSTGKVTGKSIGNATITAKFDSYDDATYEVYVQEGTSSPTQGARLDILFNGSVVTEAIVDSGSGIQLNAQYYDGNTTKDVTSDVSWTGNNGMVVSVDTNGYVIGYDVGKTEIHASYTKGNTTITAYITIKVCDTELYMSSNRDTLYVTDNTQMKARINIGGSLKDVTTEATWSSNNKSIAKVDNKGIVTGYGEGNVTITAVYSKNGNNYIGTYDLVVTRKKMIDNQLPTYTEDEIYTGKEIKKEVIITDGQLLIEGVHYTVEYTDNINVGTATMKIIGKGKYKGTVTKQFKILQKDITTFANLTVSEDFYTGKEIKQNVVLKYSDKTLKEGTDYTVSYKDNINVGTATITITGKGNFKGTLTKQYRIFAKPVPNIMQISNETYTGNRITKNITLKWANTILNKGTDYDISYQNNIDIGKATIKVTGKGNYTGTSKQSFIILPQAPTNIRLVTRNTNSLIIGWNAPKSGVSAYRIYMYNSSKKIWEYKHTTDKTSTTISGLQPSQAYIFKVCGYVKVDNKLYKGAFTSNLTCATRPITPTIKSLKSTGAKNTKQLKLIWTKSENATGYEVAFYTSKTKSWSILDIKGASNISKLYSNLAKEKLTYKFRVRAYRLLNGKKVYSPYTDISSINY